MKKKPKEHKQMRVPLEAYEKVRQLAYKTHRPMTEILLQIIEEHKAINTF